MKISLVGYMGSGKTSLGKKLAVKMDLPFIDLDQELEKLQGETVSEMILNRGELFFRKLERQHLEKVLALPEFVLATGGGTPCYYDNMQLINSKSLSFFLRMSVRDLYQNLLAHRRERPLIAHLNDKELQEFIAKHLMERNPIYNRAIFSIDPKLVHIEERLKAIEELIA
jgi:shikimate kinase